MAPISNAVSIDDDQRFALMKFRRSVSDILKPEHDDQFLLRWLRARQWNPEAAEKMLRDSVEWREKWCIDTTLPTWEAPAVLEQYFPSGSTGFDKEGSPVIIVPFAGLDVWGLLHCVSRSDCTRMIIRHLENYMTIARKQAEKHGPNALKVIAVMDMEGFNMRQYAWRPAGELVISLLQMYESNYPEILKCCLIVNAPSVFSLAFSIVKKFMHEYTLSKIKIFKADPKKWQRELLALVDADQLPAHYGGTLTGEDGDPKCSHIIKLGGKVPKSLYTRRHSGDGSKSFTKVTVKTGEKHALDLICPQPGCMLKWEFGVESNDIKFSIQSMDEEGNTSVVHGPRKVSGGGTLDTGVLPVNGPSTLSVIFDNTDSYLRSKKIFYDVSVALPLHEQGLSLYPDDDKPDTQAMSSLTL